MTGPGSARGHRWSTLWLAALIGLALALAGQTGAGRYLERRGFDLLTRLTAPGASRLPITIVGIDEASFAELRRQWPWPRSLHADLVQRLADAGAAVVIFDVLFAEATDPENDARFEKALRYADNVVLAADMVFQETSHVRQWLRIDPLPALREAGARVGLAGVSLDADAVVRQLPEYGDALWRVGLRRFQELRPGLVSPAEPPPGALLGYLGPDHTFPYVSYYQALDPAAFLPEGFFQDQIVFVGRDSRSSPDAGAAQADTFATPFTSRTRWFTPGVELHATALESVVASTAIRPLPRGAQLALVAVALLIAALAMWRWRPLPSALVGVVIVAAIAVGTWWLFRRYHLWLPAVGGLAAAPALYVALGGREYLSERRQRRTLASALGHYLSRPVLAEILAHPERLALGGARCEVTLLFSDLAGFTSVSERLSPEQVAQLLNRHLTEMTGIILGAGGTVDKFIGDAVMAFWGAPLPDARQADHACAVAFEMQQAMVRLRAELAAQGLPELHMRIGLHTGPAVVGNMGSHDRFDYTAIGDTVNLASRLEGVNKLYGTQILLTEDTRAQLTDLSRIRPVDRVCVKGKQQPVEIFTLSDSPELCAATQAAIGPYRARDWERSEALWREVLALAPRDHLAAVYLERIGRFRQQPPPEDWGGAVSLEKM